MSHRAASQRRYGVVSQTLSVSAGDIVLYMRYERQMIIQAIITSAAEARASAGLMPQRAFVARRQHDSRK